MHLVNSIKMETDHYVPSNSPTAFNSYHQVHHNLFNYLPCPHSPTLYQNFDSREYFDQQEAQNFVLYQKNVIARGIEDILGGGGHFSDNLALYRYQRQIEDERRCNEEYRAEIPPDGSLDYKIFGNTVSPTDVDPAHQQNWNCLVGDGVINSTETKQKDFTEVSTDNSNLSKSDLILGKFFCFFEVVVDCSDFCSL